VGGVAIPSNQNTRSTPAETDHLTSAKERTGKHPSHWPEEDLIKTREWNKHLGSEIRRGQIKEKVHDFQPHLLSKSTREERTAPTMTRNGLQDIGAQKG